MAIQNGDKDGVARFLGWFSIALGGTQVVAPRALARVIGLAGHDTQKNVMRVMGMREIATGVGILGESRPMRWLWARVAGDALDMALLAPSRMRFRRGSGDDARAFELVLPPRSGYVLAGEARTKWQHHIPPTKALRYSVTFRTLNV